MKKTLSVLIAAIMILSLVSAFAVTASAAWDGTSSVPFEGEGTAAKPYIIASAENLKDLQKQVDEGNDFEGSYFTQTADIDLGGKEWTPIGTSAKPFSGVYDGLGHKITGLYITKEDTNAIGLFGYITSGWSGQAGIMNLEVSGEFIFEELTKDTGLGGVVGWVYKDGSDGFKRTQLINITSNVNITVKATAKQPRFGAVFGYVFDSDVTNVVNNGNIDYKGSANSRVGGITGQTNRTTYTGCVNNGNIKVEMTNPNETTNVSAHVGGICGMTTYKIVDLYTIYDGCINNGSIDVSVQTGKIYLGGISGATYSSGADLYLELKNCLNNGSLKGEQKDLTVTNAPAYVGGISAKVGNGFAYVHDCVNNTTDIISICGIGDYSGGIVSMWEKRDDNTVTIKDCLTLSDRISTTEPKLNENKAPEEGCEISALAAQLTPKVDAIKAAIKPVADAEINGFPGAPEETTPEVTTAEETTPEVTADQTEPEATGEVTTPEATQPSTPVTTAPEPAKKGCGSSAAVGAVAIIAICASAFTRRKED